MKDDYNNSDKAEAPWGETAVKENEADGEYLTDVEAAEYFKKFEEGDRDAYRVLYDNFYKIVYKKVNQCLYEKNKEYTEEAVQNTFVALYEKHSQIKEPRALIGWLCTVARNEAFKINRRYKNINKKEDSADLGSDGFSPAKKKAAKEASVDSIQRFMQLTEDAEMLDDLLGYLSDNQRDAITMRYIEGYKQSEIAQELGVDHKTVKYRIDTGIETMKKKYIEGRKKGLYSFVFFPLFFFRLIRSTKAASACALTPNPVAAAPVSKASIVTRAALSSSAKRIVAGAVAVTVAGGGIAGTAAAVIKNNPSEIVGHVLEANPPEDFEYTVEQGKCIITGFNKEMTGELVIPSEIDGYPVTSIGNGGRRELTGEINLYELGSIYYQGVFPENRFTAIYLPDTIETVEAGAFSDSKELKVISLGKNLTSLGNGAFRNCPKLEEATLPDSLETIGECVFQNCTALKQVNISAKSKINVIGMAAFENSGITSINIPSGVAAIESKTFSGCASLKSIDIPGNITSIDEGAFMNSGLNSVYIPKSVKVIGPSTTEPRTEIGPDGEPRNVVVGYIGTFQDCKKLSDVKIESGVSVAELSFLGCDSLKNITYINEDGSTRTEKAVTKQ